MSLHAGESQADSLSRESQQSGGENNNYWNSLRGRSRLCEPAGEEAGWKKRGRWKWMKMFTARKIGSKEERSAKNSCEISRCSRTCRRTFGARTKKSASRSYKILSRRGMINKCRSVLKSYRVYRTERSSAKRMLGNALETWNGSDTKMKKKLLNSKNWDECSKIYLAGGELDQEIRSLQAGEDRRGSCGSQSNGWCFDPVVVEQVITMVAAQAWQQIQALQGVFKICPTSRKLHFSTSQNFGVLLLRTCLLACFPPPLVLCSPAPEIRHHWVWMISLSGTKSCATTWKRCCFLTFAQFLSSSSRLTFSWRGLRSTRPKRQSPRRGDPLA